MAANFKIIVTAVDSTAGVLERINKRQAERLDALKKRFAVISAPVQRLGKELATFSRLSGISDIAKGIERIGRGAFAAFQNVARIVAPLSAITGAASVAGMYKLVEAWGLWGSRIGFAATQIGIPVDRLNALQGAAVLAGGSADAMTSSLQGLGQTMYDAIGGRNAEAYAMFSQLGISIEGVGRHAIPADVALRKLADAVQRAKDPFAQLRIVTAAGVDPSLLPLLRGGGRAIDEYIAKAKKYGAFTAAGAAAANKLREAQADLTWAVTGLGNAVAERLAPVVGPMLIQFADWISRMRTSKFVTHDLAIYAKELGDFLANIPWKSIIRDLKGVAISANAVAQAFGGWKHIVEGIIALKLAGWATSAVTPIVGLLRLMALIPGSGVTAAALAEAGITIGVPAAVTAAVAAPLAYGLKKGVEALDPALGIDPSKLNPRANIRGGTRGAYLGPSRADNNATPPNNAGGFANNNPTNLSYFPGQPGVQGRNGRWGVYASPEAGIAAGLHQMLLDQDRGYNTIRKEITKRSPPSENDTEGMIKRISQWSGLDPDAPLDLRNPVIANRFLSADIRQENHAIDPSIVNRGVAMALGTSAAPTVRLADGSPGAAGAAGASGKVDVKVTVAGAGVQKVTASSSGNVNMPKVATTGVGNTAMAGA